MTNGMKSMALTVAAALAFAPAMVYAQSGPGGRGNGNGGTPQTFELRNPPNNPVGSITVPVSGTGRRGEVFSGTAKIVGFTVDRGAVQAVAILNGVVTGGAGQTVSGMVVSFPVSGGDRVINQQTPALSCQILNLVLGPIFLNLLGLVVTTNQIIINIFAVPGQLLGDLLCAVVNLLNGGLGGLLGQVALLLNQILAILGPVTLPVP